MIAKRPGERAQAGTRGPREGGSHLPTLPERDGLDTCVWTSFSSVEPGVELLTTPCCSPGCVGAHLLAHDDRYGPPETSTSETEPS